MGTRADFYVGRGETAEWLGSIAWDGYPKGIKRGVLKAKSETDYRESVASFLAEREDATLPEMGWPWPWDNSQTTDYAYAFDDGQVFGTCFGLGWWPVVQEPAEINEDVTKVAFPDMSKRRNVTFGARSGVIVIGG